MRDKNYCSIVENPIATQDAHRLFYLDPDQQAVDLFRSVNGLSQRSELLYPGQLLMAPSLDGISEAARSGAGSVVEQFNYGFRNGSAVSSPKLLNENLALLSSIVENRDDIKTGTRVTKFAAEYAKEHFKGISDDLKRLRAAYQVAADRKIGFGSSKFQTLREPIEKSLEARLVGLSKNMILKNPDAPSMKDAIGISHTRIKNTVRSGASRLEIKEVKTALEKVGKASAIASKVGKVIKAVDVGVASAAVYSDFEKKGAAQGFHTMAREAGGIAGGTWGGAQGAALGGSAATAALIFFGVSTGGLGLVAIGIGVAGGAILGGMAGSAAGKASVDGWKIILDSAAEKTVDWIVEVDQP